MNLEATFSQQRSAFRGQRKASRAFTLIELLTVIGIIAVLVGLLFPAIKKSIQKAEITQARGDIKNIEQAIKAFMNEYGYLPGNCAGGSTDVAFSNAGVMNALRGLDATLNPRSVVFIQDTTRKGAFDSSGNFLDPWGTPYYIMLDCNYDNTINYNGYTNVNMSAVIASFGPNKIQEDPSLSKSDDIVNYQ